MNIIADCRMRNAEINEKIKELDSESKSAPRNCKSNFRDFSPGNSCEFLRAICNPQSEIRTGFTLLEVLVSLAIVSITLVVLIHSQLLSMRQGTHSKYYTTAIFLGNEILTNTLMQENLIVGNEDEDFSDYPGFSWEREIEDTEIEGLKKVKIIISGPENTQIVLNTYCLSGNILQVGKKK